MVSFAIQFLIFIVVVVIVILGVQWLLAKLGVAIDPTLKTIIGLILFLVLLVFFLNWIGAFPSSGTLFRH
jgi:hypothetical protein